VERSARLAAERDALIGELAHATGLGGRPRRLGDVTERARSTVTARIRDAIGRIERVHPELGRHLRASIVTGARVLLSAGRDRAVEHLTIVRPDLTPSGQGKETLMAIDEQKMEEGGREGVR
jgi:hypothetical protein